MTERDICNPKPSKIVVYTALWCPDCKRVKAFLDGRRIEHLEVDIGKNNEAYRFVERVTRRVRIPTIIFPDGMMMIDPTDSALDSKLGKK